MNKTKRAAIAADAPAIDLIEDGVHLLREAGARGLLLQLLGGGPFALFFIYFWFTMSRSPGAEQVGAAFALGLALLYFWMRFWQARLCLLLWELATGQPPERQTIPQQLASVARLVLWQGLYLPVQLLSLVATVTLPWTTGFFQAQLVMAFHGGKQRGFSRLGAMGSAAPVQMAALLTYCLIGWFVLAVNLLVLLIFTPGILKSIFGIHTELARLGEHLLNADTTLIAFVLAWLIVSPLVKAVAVIRTFQNESRTSGEDILAELRRLRPVAATLALGFLTFLGAPHPALGQDAPPAQETIQTDELDRAIERAFNRPELAWREQGADAAQGIPVNWVADFYEWLGRQIVKFFGGRDRSSDSDFQMNLAPLVWTLVIILGLVVLVIILQAVMKARTAEPPPIAAPPPPDVRDEAVQADALPPNEWEELAQTLLAQGDFRAALRAFFLAQISTLTSVGLIHFARYKTNRDYYRELQRYAAGNGELTGLFNSSTSLFEGIWYGGHPAGRDEAEQLGAMTTQMRRMAS